MAKEEVAPIEQNYEYTAIFYFSGADAMNPGPEVESDTKILMLKASAVCPKLVFHQINLTFGDI